VRVLLAYDGSEAAGRALDWSVRVARGEPGSGVTVLAVATALEAAPPIADAIDPRSGPERLRELLARAAGTLTAAGVEADTLLRVGSPAEEIIRVADDGGYDLVVLGNTGSGGAVRFLMGSVSDRVVRHAARPVMVVR
jgi:nucleotide-binding universal stress UspA family protein